ncbi:MAG TPA: ABC transporter ATP-binding protein [Candidatus Marinimicrobia bacterium]|nr:ABC transporter ATP-binding protein [Candidatus Neomarinimicrobiota bacterium]
MKTSVYTRLVRLVIPYWPFLVLSTLSAFIYVIFNCLSIWLTASLFNNILTDFDELIQNHEILTRTKVSINDQLKYWTNELILRDSPVESLKVLCLVLLGAFFIKNIFLYLKNISLTYIQFNLITSLRNRIYGHLHSMSLSYFDKARSGELTSIVINDVSNMRVAFGTSFHKLFVEPINIVVFVALLIIINVKLALVAAIIVPLTGATIIAIGKSIRRKSKRTAEKIARIMNIMTENLNSIRVVKAFAMESHETERFHKEQKRYYQLLLKRAKLRLISSPLTETIGAIIGVTLLWIGGRDVLVSAGMTSEDFIRFILILFSVLGPVRLLSNASMELQKGVASAERVFDVLDTPSAIVSKSDAEQITAFNERISFDQVSFHYEGSDTVLDDISFELKKGTILALVGPSGAGKSTIADLIPRFYDVNSGRITIDGKDICDIELNSLRRLMGIVSQETILFDDTIRSNITYGINSTDEDQLKAVARTANALDFILEQPQGFDTVIGEKGVRLSGGQRQRIAIARAVLKNPPILILDEATSALDTESERLVQSALETLIADRTVLVIAHRLSTIQKADMIIVMDEGRIVEQGNHDNLVAKKGLYSKLHKNQFRY